MTLNTSFFYFLFSPTKNRGDFTGKFPCQIWGHKKYKKRWHLKMTLKKIFLFYVISFFTHCTTLFLFTVQNIFYNTKNITKQKLFWVFFKIFCKILYNFLFFSPKILSTNQKYSKTISNLKYFFRKIFFLTNLNSVFHPAHHPTSEKEKWTNLFLIYQLISIQNQFRTYSFQITNQFFSAISTNF